MPYEVTPEEILHFGVKGMQWGVRKQRRAELNKPHPGYSTEQRVVDRGLVGKGGVRRINRDMNRGKTHQKAQNRELNRRAATRAGAIITLAVVSHFGKKAILNLPNPNGPRAITDVRKLIRPKKGVYKITDL